MLKKSKNRVLFITTEVKQVDFGTMPEIGIIAEFAEKNINIDNQIELWKSIISIIERHYNDYDGFIVIKEPDSIIYDAIACEIAFIKINKPIIFTSAPFESGFFELGIKTNIINSIQLIKEQIAGVFIVYGKRVVLPSKAKKINLSRFDAFHSIDDEYLGEIGIGLRLNKSRSSFFGKSLKVINKFDNSIGIMYLHPGLIWSYYHQLLKKSKVLIIKSSRQQGLRQNDIDYLVSKFKDKPILIYNKLGLIKNCVSPEQFIYIDDMTWERMVVRSMWVLANIKKLKDFKKLFFDK